MLVADTTHTAMQPYLHPHGLHTTTVRVFPHLPQALAIAAATDSWSYQLCPLATQTPLPSQTSSEHPHHLSPCTRAQAAPLDEHRVISRISRDGFDDWSAGATLDIDGNALLKSFTPSDFDTSRGVFYAVHSTRSPASLCARACVRRVWPRAKLGLRDAP